MSPTRARTGRLGLVAILVVLLAGAVALGHGESGDHSQTAGDHDAGGSVTAPEHSDSLAEEVAAMRRQLHTIEDRRSLQDIIGAVGYIFGLAGVAFYILGRRRAQGDEAAADNCPTDDAGESP